MTLVHPLSLIDFCPAVATFARAATLATLCADPSGAASAVAVEAHAELREGAPASFDADQFASSLLAGSMQWREQLAELAARCDAARLRVVLADDCIANPVIEEDALSGGLFGRRYNAALDLADAPFTVGDVQDLFATTAVGLADNKITWGHQGMMFVGNFALGAVGGMFGIPGAGVVGRHGSEFFLSRIAEVDEAALSTAQLLTAVHVMLAGDDCQDDFLTATWHALIDELVDLYSEAGSRKGAGHDIGDLISAMRVLEAGESEVRTLVDSRQLRGTRRPIPNVCGWSALAAGHLLEALGYNVTAQDATGSRGIWNKEGWQVLTQSAPAGSTAYDVRLECRKWSD